MFEKCAFCGRQIESIASNKFAFRNPVTGSINSWYVCEACRRAYMPPEPQAINLLERWKGGHA